MNRIKTVVGIFLTALFLVACTSNADTDMEEITQEFTQVETQEKTQEVTSEVSSVGEIQSKETNAKIIKKFYIYLCGAVIRPGVYEVEPGTRIYEVIALAGGLTEKAADHYVNQAAEVIDGEQIIIPTIEETKKLEEQGTYSLPPSVEQKKEEGGKIDLNKATKEQLCTIPGVGENKADTIITYRNEHGEFQTIEEITKVNGIKEGMYAKMKDYITVGR